MGDLNAEFGAVVKQLEGRPALGAQTEKIKSEFGMLTRLGLRLRRASHHVAYGTEFPTTEPIGAGPPPQGFRVGHNQHCIRNVC